VDRILRIFFIVIMVQPASQVMDPVAHGSVLERRIVAGFPKSLYRNSALVQTFTCARDFPFANISQKALQLVRAVKRTAAQHPLQSFAFFRLPHFRHETLWHKLSQTIRYKADGSCSETVYDHWQYLSIGYAGDRLARRVTEKAPAG
jgi:hypothetical protein